MEEKGTGQVTAEEQEMKCPYCGSENNVVVETRQRENNTVLRRRKCHECTGRFNTSEAICRGRDGNARPVKEAIVLATGSNYKNEFVLLVRNKKKEEKK